MRLFDLTDPGNYLGAGTGHMVAGGLVTLIVSPLFTYFLGFPHTFLKFSAILLPALACGLSREIYQAINDETTFKGSMTNIAEWVFGAVIFAGFIALNVSLA